MTQPYTSPTDTCILKVVVGSHAHGLARPDSDKDFRSVFVLPTAELLRIGFKYQGTRMMKEEDDETAWEIGHFLQLALQGHPLVLETLVAPVVTMNEWGSELRQLFPRLWSAQAAYDAFLNYCDNQRKKMLEKKDGRPENTLQPMSGYSSIFVSYWNGAPSASGFRKLRSVRQSSKSKPDTFAPEK